MAWSRDGLRWHPLNGNAPVLRSAIGSGSLRDPHLVRREDGAAGFHLVATDGWNSTSVLYGNSSDLISWSLQLLPVAARLAGARNAWAPELRVDAAARRHLLLWATTRGGWGREKLYFSWAELERGGGGAVALTPPEVLFDPGFTVIGAPDV